MPAYLDLNTTVDVEYTMYSARMVFSPIRRKKLSNYTAHGSGLRLKVVMFGVDA